MPASELHFATSIMTADGGTFDYARIGEPGNLPSLEALAHQLALTNRFAGATRVPYSVAEHAVRVSWLCEHVGGDEWWGLHHDDVEGVLADIPRPAKKLIPDFQRLEREGLRAVERRWGLAPGIPIDVHWADAVLLVTEGRDLCHSDWPLDELSEQLSAQILWLVRPLDDPIEPMPWEQARELYINRHHALVMRAQAEAEEAGLP